MIDDLVRITASPETRGKGAPDCGRGAFHVGHEVSGKSFRQALGEFATGVAVVTAEGAGDEPLGLTISSFNSVSVEPPLVLFSVARTASSLPAMLEAKGFAVNVLAHDQEALAQRFSRTVAGRWSDVERRAGHEAAPLIAGALAHLECAPYAHHDGGDHVIFLARVVRYTVRSGKAAPLIFFRGEYRGLVEVDASMG